MASKTWSSAWSRPPARPRWKHAYPSDYSDPLGKGDGPRSTPILTANRVYTVSAFGLVLCLDAANGKVIWQRDLDSDYTLRRSYFGLGNSPLLEGGLLLINVGAKDAGIVALDAATGKEVWKATDHAASYASPVAAVIDGARVAVFFTREGLVILNPATGAVRARRWRTHRRLGQRRYSAGRRQPHLPFGLLQHRRRAAQGEQGWG